MNLKKENKKHSVWLSESAWTEVESRYQQDNCSTRNEFIEKAIRFYSGYLDAESADEYLPRVLADVLEGKLGALGKRIAKGAKHEPAPIPEEGKWVHSKKIEDISGFTHGVGWCAPQQGACKLTLNVKNGIIEEALIETIGCSGMTHSAAMAAEILQGKTILEALNTDLVCDAINTAMRELFLQIVYGRTQSAFSDDGLAIGAGLEDLGKGLRSQVGTMYATKEKGVRYLEMAEGYVTGIALDEDNEVIGYQFVSLGKMTDFIKNGDDPNTAWEKAKGQYGRVADAAKIIDPRKE